MRRHGRGGPHSQRIAFFVAVADPAHFKAGLISSRKGPRLSEIRPPAGKPENGRKILASNTRRYPAYSTAGHKKRLRLAQEFTELTSAP
jgi:hypothetical protein